MRPEIIATNESKQMKDGNYPEASLRTNAFSYRNTIIVAGILIVFAAGGMAVLIALSSADSKNNRAAGMISQAFETALMDGAREDAFALTSHRFQQNCTQKEFVELIGKYAAFGSPMDATYHYRGELFHDPGSLEFKYVVDLSNNGHSVSFTYIVLNEEEQWRVDSLVFVAIDRY